MTYTVQGEPGEVFDIELDEDLKRANETIAEENRRQLQRHGVCAVDVMGSVGSGKTSLIEQLVRLLKGRYRIVAFKGDLTTRIDSERIASLGIRTVQINTGRECHLDANLVKKALAKVDLGSLDLIFIENVGNLVCPASFDLGESERWVLLSSPEGDDKPVKYPEAFLSANALVLTKADLLPYVPFDVDRARREALFINPRLRVFVTSAVTGQGLDELEAHLVASLGSLRSRRA